MTQNHSYCQESLTRSDTKRIGTAIIFVSSATTPLENYKSQKNSAKKFTFRTWKICYNTKRWHICSMSFSIFTSQQTSIYLAARLYNRVVILKKLTFIYSNWLPSYTTFSSFKYHWRTEQPIIHENSVINCFCIIIERLYSPSPHLWRTCNWLTVLLADPIEYDSISVKMFWILL